MKIKRIGSLLLTGLLLITMLLPVEVFAAHENVYVNTGNYRADIIGVARTQVGYRETLNNTTKYGAWYGLDNQPWCAMFVSWCARQAKIPQSVIRNSAVAAPDANYHNLAYKDGKSYTPKMGDVFFKKDFSHNGLVYHVDGDYFYTIEGNTNNDGSDLGHSVMVRKHETKNYYFGYYTDGGVQAPAGPVVSTAKSAYTSGQTVRIQWGPVAGAASYSVVVYRNGLICESANVGTATMYDFKHAQYGEYLVSVSANYSNGKIGYTQHAFDVAYAPSLYVQYNANGGEINPQYQYVVVGGEGVNMRAAASVSATRYTMIPVGTLLSATQIKTSEGYTWANVTYSGKTGWCIVSEGFCDRVGYTKTAAGDLIQYPNEGRAVTTWGAGSGEQKALLDPQTAGLTRKDHVFVGWSKSKDGSGTVFRQDQTNITAEQIEPGFAYADSYVQMYAVWQKLVNKITIEKLPDKVQYFTDDTLDTTGLRIRVKYVDGTEAVVNSGFSVSGFESDTVGTKTVKVHYYDATATFDVNVNARMKFEIKDGAAVVTRYEHGSGVVIIPAKYDDVPVKSIAPGAFAGCSQITGLILPDGITQIGDGAFSGCSSLSVVNYTGTKEAWDAIAIGADNEMLTNATLNCNYIVLGDYNGDMQVNNADVIYLLWHTLYPNHFPIVTTADLNADGAVNNADVIRLLWHTLYPDNFPLTAALAISEEEPSETPPVETEEEPEEDPAEEVPDEDSEEEPAEEPVNEPNGENEETPVDETEEGANEEPEPGDEEEPIEIPDVPQQS